MAVLAGTGIAYEKIASATVLAPKSILLLTSLIRRLTVVATEIDPVILMLPGLPPTAPAAEADIAVTPGSGVVKDTTSVVAPATDCANVDCASLAIIIRPSQA